MALIINELLCYMVAKIDSVPTEILTRLVDENFTDAEVDAAKNLLCEHVDESIKAGPKRGQKKKKHDLDDIVKMLVLCDRSNLPKFVALELSKLPPISIDCIDVSSIMRKQQLQDVEMAQLKDLVHEILAVTVETSKRVETSLLSNPRSSPSAVPVSGSEPPATAVGEPALPSAGPGEPALPPAGPGEARATGPTYSEVVRNAITSEDTDGWSLANRKKRTKMPTPKKPGNNQGQRSPSNATGSSQQMRQTVKKAVIGSKKTGPIKAVATVKRLSVFMSRLPPGTGEDAIKSYVLEQTGAEEVTAQKLKTKFNTYESYRLDITNPSCDNILDPELWAQGLVVRRFFTKKNSSDGEAAAPGKSPSSPSSEEGSTPGSSTRQASASEAAAPGKSPPSLSSEEGK